MTDERIVITGIGLTAPNGNTLQEFRKNLLNGVSGVQDFETRYMGKVHAGVCDFDELKYKRKKNAVAAPESGPLPFTVRKKPSPMPGLISKRSTVLKSASTSESPSMAMSKPRTKSITSANTVTTLSTGRTIIIPAPCPTTRQVK